MILDFLKSLVVAFWELFSEMSPYLVLGFLLAGILHVYFPKDKVNKYLGKRNLKSVINAALVGVPLPLCSCGVIPTGVSFHKNGASKGASVSFLISTPQTGVDSILATYSLMGLPFAVIRPIVALITGITGGLFTNK
ncbi:permease, partial [Salibacter sp.]|uniref:permease n=1 Tax=Salibacter sp. TaxID=2010995 RepID=UPI0028706627